MLRLKKSYFFVLIITAFSCSVQAIELNSEELNSEDEPLIERETKPKTSLLTDFLKLALGNEIDIILGLYYKSLIVDSFHLALNKNEFKEVYELVDKIKSEILKSEELGDCRFQYSEWESRILIDDYPDAFCFPGTVYITTGLLNLLNNSDELASIIAYEFIPFKDRKYFFRSIIEWINMDTIDFHKKITGKRKEDYKSKLCYFLCNFLKSRFAYDKAGFKEQTKEAKVLLKHSEFQTEVMEYAIYRMNKKQVKFTQIPFLNYPPKNIKKIRPSNYKFKDYRMMKIKNHLKRLV